MPKITKKFLIVLFSAFYFLLSTFSPLTTAHAADEAGSWYNQNPFDWAAKVYDAKNPSEIFGERYTAAQVQWIIYSLISFPFATIDTLNPDGPCLLSSISGGAIDMATCSKGIFTGLIDGLKSVKSSTSYSNEKDGLAVVFDVSNRDLSGIKYLSQKINGFKIISEANAQEGFGYGSLGLVQNLWKASRNFSYSIIVLITIIFAFMIMFRVKLSPQLVISVQSALPKVFTALILATFSYAIAGFLVDLMYVFTGLISAMLSSVFTITTSFTETYRFMTGSGFSGFIVVFLYMLIYTIMFIILVLFNIISVITTWSIFQLILSVLFLLVAVWLIILTLWYTIKIPWVLIKALANIYMSVVVAPLQIVFGAIAPQIGFGAWIKNLIANLLVFPVTGLFFYLAYLLLFQAFVVLGDVVLERNVLVEVFSFFGMTGLDGILPGQLWSPPLLGSGAEISSLIIGIMSFLVIVAIPKATDIVKMIVMGAKFDFGTAIGEAIQPVGMYGRYAMGEMGRGTEGSLPWPFNKSKVATDWWKDQTGKSRSFVRSVAQTVTGTK